MVTCCTVVCCAASLLQLREQPYSKNTTGTHNTIMMHICAVSDLLLTHAATSGYNGSHGATAASAYGTQSHDRYSQAYGSTALQSQTPSSPYGAATVGGYGGGSYGAPAPNAFAGAAPPPVRAQVCARTCLNRPCVPSRLTASLQCNTDVDFETLKPKHSCL